MMSSFAVVQLAEGTKVRGKYTPLSSDPSRGCYEFFGLPYAEQPVNERRFKPPAELKLWSGLKDCLNYGKLC